MCACVYCCVVNVVMYIFLGLEIEKDRKAVEAEEGEVNKSFASMIDAFWYVCLYMLCCCIVLLFCVTDFLFVVQVNNQQ